MDAIITGVFGVIVALVALLASRNERKAIIDEQTILAKLTEGSAEFLEMSESISHRIRRLVNKSGPHRDMLTVFFWCFGMGYLAIFASTLIFGSFGEVFVTLRSDRTLKTVLKVLFYAGLAVGLLAYVVFQIDSIKAYVANARRRAALYAKVPKPED